MLKSTIFREYDIRGIAEAELRDADVHDLGKAIGTYLQRHNGRNINLGRDCRLSSERLRNALIGGLNKSIALQPLSLEGNKGLNVAAGIGSITLKASP